MQGFLLVVARRRCLNVIRSDQYNVPLSDAHLADHTVAVDVGQIDLDLHLRQALAELPMQYRETFLFFEVEGYSYEEIAEHMGVSFNVVRNRIYRAKKALQGLLEPVWMKKDR